MITKDFLESKLLYYIPGEVLHKCSSGNIKRISDNVFSFVEYNFLPGEDGKLDGHYKFYVNYKTFDYLIIQDSYYGSFTYVTEPTQKGWITDLNDREKKIVESIIAHKLLCAYFYDPDEICNKGINLIEDSNIKRCLITDYRGYVWTDLKPQNRSEKEIEALTILDKDFIKKSVTNLSLGKIRNVEKGYQESGRFKLKYYNYSLPVYVTVNGDVVEYELARYRDGVYFHFFDILKDGVSLIGYPQNYKGKPSDIVKIIPEIIESL